MTNYITSDKALRIRELEAQGMSLRDIAKECGISKDTVPRYLSKNAPALDRSERYRTAKLTGLGYVNEMRMRTHEMKVFMHWGHAKDKGKDSYADFDIWEGVFFELLAGDEQNGAAAMAAMVARVVEQLVAEYGKIPTIKALRNMAQDIDASLPKKQRLGV